jgi:hypothetical protein
VNYFWRFWQNNSLIYLRLSLYPTQQKVFKGSNGGGGGGTTFLRLLTRHRGCCFLFNVLNLGGENKNALRARRSRKLLLQHVSTLFCVSAECVCIFYARTP